MLADLPATRMKAKRDHRVPPVPVAPVDKHLGRQLRAVVEPERLGTPVERHQLIEHPYHPCRRDRRADLDGQALAIVFVEHVQRAEAS